MRRGALSIALAVIATANALAAQPLGPNGSRIRTSSFGIDGAAGPVIAGTRATGLAGSYVAIAEGVDGDSQNPASPAVRRTPDVDWFTFDLGFQLLFPARLESGDFFNTGRGRTELTKSDQSEFAVLQGAGNVSFGPWGFGISTDLERYGLRRLDPLSQGIQPVLVRAQLSTVRLYAARAIDDGQLVGGVGFHVLALDLTTRDEIVTRSGNLFTTRGVGFEAGLLWRPNEQPFRFGLALRAPIVTSVDSFGFATPEGDITLATDPSDPNAIYLPSSVRRPWSADAGIAVQIGPRPLNPRFIDPHERLFELERFLEYRAERRRRRAALELARVRAAGGDVTAAREAIDSEIEAEQALDRLHLEHERQRLHGLLTVRYRRMARRYLLIAAALHADGAVADSVGIESFLQGYVDRSGERVTLSPRLGLETELIPDWLVVRGGSYLEPSRFREGSPRLHGTFGFDAKLFPWTVFGLFEKFTEWQAGAAIDLARDYFGWGVSIGVWH